MRYWNRSLISTTKRSPSSTESSGIFDLISHQVYQVNGLWPTLANDGLTTNGLYLHLDAGDSDSYPGSGNTWSDLTSNNLDFTLYNGTAYNSGFDGHFIFDGSNDHFEISSGWTSFGTDLFTIEFWFRQHTTALAEALIATQGGGDGSFQVAPSAAQKMAYQATAPGASQTTTVNSTETTLNVWKQMVFVREGTGTDQFKIYVNGSLNTTSTMSVDHNSTLQLRIGRNRNGAHYFDGDIAIIRIYKNKALNAAEVVANYNNNRSRFSLPAAGVITDSLILHLDAGNSSSYGGSGTTWTDLSGNSNNGTLTNGPTFDSNNQGSIVFDGSDDLVSISDSSSIDVTPTVTISAWINPSGFGENNFGRIVDSEDSYNFFLDNSTVTSGIRYWPNAGNAFSVANCVTLDEWANFVVVHSGSNVTIYKNGVSIGTSSGISTLPSTSSGLFIGNSDVGDRAFEGKISQVLVYSKALSASDVLTNYNRLKDRYL